MAEKVLPSNISYSSSERFSRAAVPHREKVPVNYNYKLEDVSAETSSWLHQISLGLQHSDQSA